MRHNKKGPRHMAMIEQQARHDTLAAVIWPSTGRMGEMNALLRGALLAFAGSLLLWACAKISIPIGPVPVAMTTFGVLAIGMAYGSRLATATLLLYLAEGARSEEHTSELQSLMRISYAVFCLKK